MKQVQVAGLATVLAAGSFLGGCSTPGQTQPGLRNPAEAYVAPKAGPVDFADQIVTLNPTSTTDQDNGLVAIRPQENGGYVATAMFYSPVAKGDVVFTAPVTDAQVKSMQGAVEATANRGTLDTNREYRLRGATQVTGSDLVTAKSGMNVVFDMARFSMKEDPKSQSKEALVFKVTGASTLINGSGGTYTLVITNPTPVQSVEEAQKAMGRINGETQKPEATKTETKPKDGEKVSFLGGSPAFTVAVANQLVRARA